MTSAIAKPSGMLWTAMAMLMKSPSTSPPPKLQPRVALSIHEHMQKREREGDVWTNLMPIPTPSANECSVMTPMISSTLRAFRPLSSPNRSDSYFSSTLVLITVRLSVRMGLVAGEHASNDDIDAYG